MKYVNCPTCLKKVAWNTANQYRPFCSERCKLLDLGEWATGRHAIAGEPAFMNEDGQLEGEWQNHSGGPDLD